ncbi:MAG: glycosyltransferase family 4 protein [Crocinitomicaceae bacterium]
MKILQLCHKPPMPNVDGGCIAMSSLAKGLLKKGVSLKILTASTEKHPFLPKEIPADFQSQTSIENIFLDTRINVVDAFSALVTSDSYNISRFFSPDLDRRLIELLQENSYDIIHLESLFMTPYISTIREHSSAKIILRSHNLEHLIWERLANSTGNKAKKMYLKHLAAKLKKYEQKTINEVDGIAAISNQDSQRFLNFSCKKPIITIPFGVDLNRYQYDSTLRKGKMRLFHIGSMNWEPNKEGISWFVDEIWPIMEAADLEFHLAGRHMPTYLKKQSSEKFIVHGEIEDAQQFMQDYDIMIVPLLSGSGIRIKIIEAMAQGKAIISTSIGAEGIAYEHNKNILIADSAKAIAKTAIELAAHPEKIHELGKNARALIESHYDNEKIMDNLLTFYRS